MTEVESEITEKADNVLKTITDKARDLYNKCADAYAETLDKNSNEYAAFNQQRENFDNNIEVDAKKAKKKNENVAYDNLFHAYDTMIRYYTTKPEVAVKVDLSGYRKEVSDLLDTIV